MTGPTPDPLLVLKSNAAFRLLSPEELTEILRAVAKNPDALLQVIEYLSENVAVSAAWILSATIFSAEQRLAYLLLVLSARFRAADSESPAITQEQLGMLGLGTRQRVSRLLRSLASRGLVEICDGRIVIPSRGRLEEFAY
jgi:CRP-like cAMP-binding protein